MLVNARWYLGVDPGPSSGIALIGTDGRQWEGHAFQCDGDMTLFLARALCAEYRPRAVSGEKFIPSNRAGTTGKDAELTRRVFHELAQLNIFVTSYKAADVKSWATNTRLRAVNFPLGPKFKDACDAGRHALYCAVKDGKEKDPLA